MAKDGITPHVVVPQRCPSLYAICEHTKLNGQLLMLKDDDFSW